MLHAAFLRFSTAKTRYLEASDATRIPDLALLSFDNEWAKEAWGERQTDITGTPRVRRFQDRSTKDLQHREWRSAAELTSHLTCSLPQHLCRTVQVTERKRAISIDPSSLS